MTVRKGLQLAVVAVAGSTIGAMPAVAGASLPPPPPRPIVEAGDRQLLTAQGSYCYETVCADYIQPPTTAASLPLRQRQRVLVRTRVPARRLVLTTWPGYRPFITPRPFPSHRLWAFYVPLAFRNSTTLLLHVEYPAGEAQFGVKVRPG